MGAANIIRVSDVHNGALMPVEFDPTPTLYVTDSTERILLPAGMPSSNVPEEVRILIVDDIPDRLLGALQRSVNRHGRRIRLVQCGDVPEALRHIPAFRPHLLVIDLGGTWPFFSIDPSEPLPGILSIATFAAAAPCCPRMVVSRLKEAQVVGPSVFAGATGYLSLPEAQASDSDLLVILGLLVSGSTYLSPIASAAHAEWLAHPYHARSKPNIVGVPAHMLAELDSKRMTRLAFQHLDDDFKFAFGHLVDEYGHLATESMRGQKVNFYFVARDADKTVVSEALLKVAPEPAITPRQRVVGHESFRGLTPDEIAKKLGCSPDTVRSHLAGLRRETLAKNGRKAAYKVFGPPDVQIETLRTWIGEAPSPAVPPGPTLPTNVIPFALRGKTNKPPPTNAALLAKRRGRGVPTRDGNVIRGIFAESPVHSKQGAA